jgi:hypothetical protein|tara:strand:+ start:1327 stop:1557 length:231 start_codon:yes stop_codon:yes gene_type:complete
MTYQESETKYDGYAKKLFYDWRKSKKGKVPIWEKLNFKDRDEWRGVAQLMKRERRYYKKLRSKAGEKNERPTTRSS